jgi:radial spoke head protein 9
VQPNTKNDLTTIRNISWPGYLGYVFQERNTFGGIYYGNGIKNVDLAFYV